MLTCLLRGMATKGLSPKPITTRDETDTLRDASTLLGCCRDQETFDVAPADLEAAFKQLQRRLHPDKFSIGSKARCNIHTASAAFTVILLRHPSL